MELPKDAAMLLSFVNMKLRDQYDSLERMCEDLGVNRDEIEKTLAGIDYVYDVQKNQFI